MRKWRIKSRKILATLLAAVMLLVMIPTTLVDTAAADMTYVEQDGWFYFWDEQGLKDILTANADSEWIPMRFAASQSELDNSAGTMTLNSSVTIPASAYVHMRDGQLKVAALRKLTVQGTLVTRVDRAVTGSVSVEGDGVYCKYSDVTDGVSLVSELKKLGDMAAAGDVAKNLEISVMADVTVNGDLTVPAGVYMYLDEGKTLQVSGALTVKKDAVVGNYGVLKAASVNIEQGGSMSYGEGAELDYGSQLTVNGGFHGFGTVRGTGSQPSIVIGGTAEVDNYGAGSIFADVWSVNATATINNYGVLVVPLAQRASLVSGTNISYNAKDGDNGTGSVQYAVRLTDTEAGKAGVLQNAINTFDTITGKKDYELFAVSVSNAVKGQPMQLTLNENVTVDGAVDCLFLTQNDWPGDQAGFAPHVTIGEGAALTVAAGRTLSSNVPVTVNGTLDIRNEGGFTFGTPGIVVLQDGMTLNGTVLTAGLLEVYGDVAVAEGGVLHQTMGSVRIEGSLTVNGTMIVDMVDFQIKGSYTKGANATVTIGENANFNYQAKTTFNRDAILAAFAQEDVSTVTVEVNEDVTLTENLTIPKGKTLVIDGYGTLTIAPGATLALEGMVEADWEKNIDGGQLKCGAPMVIRGTFSVGTRAYANPYTTITVENGGSLVMNGSSYFAGHSFTVKSGGRVINNSRMAFGTGNTITVEDGWDSAWTQGPNATAEVNRGIYLYSNDNAAAAIQTAIAEVTGSLPEFFSYVVYVYREDDGERIELTQDVTIPTGVMLAFYNEGVMTYIAKGAALTVQGGLYSEAPITVDGKLTVSASGYANVYNNLLVGGTLTVDEDGRMYCQYLTDENEQGKAGTIVNNGSLAAEQFDLKHNEVDIGGGDDGSKVVRSLEALKSALAEGGQINYRGTELTISEDLTIPENVNLTINVTTFTVNEGVTLTNKGNVTLYGNAYLYGKLDVSSGNGYFGGNGVVKAGGEDNLVGDEYGNRQFNWTSRISKEGASETLTQEELTAAGASTLANRIEINLGSQTTLTLADGLEIRDKNVSIWGANAAKVVVNGTLSVWNYLNLDAPMTVNGTVNVYDSVYASRDITVSTGGKLHVRNYLDKDTYRQWTGSVEFENNAWIALPEGAAWDNYVTVDDGCNLCVSKSVRMSELESFLKSCNDGRKYMVTLRVDQHQGESIPVYFATGTTVVIPENVELRINNLTYRGYSAFVIGAADESGKKGEIIVNGSLRISMPAQVDGTLTINGKLWAFGGATTTVNGALTVSEGANMSCNRLAGTGTITNNGTLTANEKAVGTVIGGSGKTTIYNTRLEASNMAELKAALSSLSGSAERQTIFLCRSAMDDADPYFVIDEDITVPSGVELHMDEMRSSNFRSLTVAENAKLTIAGDVYSWVEDGVTVNGTLETLYGGQDEDGNGISNGRIAAYSVTVASTGNLVNGGNTDVNDRDEQTGGILAVEGKMENSGYINCRDLRHSGTELTNKGNIYVRQQLKIAEGCVIGNAGQVTYADCDALDKINNSENATIRWDKTVNTVEELRALLTRTENGTATLELREDCTLNEELTVPGNIELVLAADHGQTPTLTVSEGVTLSANGQLNIQKSVTLAANGTLATCNNVQVYGTLIISESGVWQQENWASVSNDGASITINGALEQSESGVELTSWRNGKIIFGANARWNEVGTISSHESSTAITGFDTGKYKLSTNDGIDYYLKRLSSGGGSGGGETSVTGDVNGDGVVDQADLVALARFMAGIDDLEDTARADINGDGIYSAADLTALARMLEVQQDTQTADADENGAPVDTGAELNADAQDTVQTEDGGAPVEPAPAVDDVPETVEESVTGEVPQTEAGEQVA